MVGDIYKGVPHNLGREILHGDVLYYHHRYLYINTIFINLHLVPQLIIIICTAWVVWKVELHCRSCWADPGQGRPRTCRNIVTASDWGIQRRHISRHTRSHITSSQLKRDQNLSRIDLYVKLGPRQSATPAAIVLVGRTDQNKDKLA